MWGKELGRVCLNSPGWTLGCGWAWLLARGCQLSVGQAYRFHLLPCTWTKPVLSSLASGTDRETDQGSYFKREKSSGAAD